MLWLEGRDGASKSSRSLDVGLAQQLTIVNERVEQISLRHVDSLEVQKNEAQRMEEWWSASVGSLESLQSIASSLSRLESAVAPRSGASSPTFSSHKPSSHVSKPVRATSKSESLRTLRQHKSSRRDRIIQDSYSAKGESETHRKDKHPRQVTWSCAKVTTGHNIVYLQRLLVAEPTGRPPASLHRDAMIGFNMENIQAPTKLHAPKLCGLCGEAYFGQSSNDEAILKAHLQRHHAFGHCKEVHFWSLNQFRQHIKHKHNGKIGRWMRPLEGLCKSVEIQAVRPELSDHLDIIRELDSPGVSEDDEEEDAEIMFNEDPIRHAHEIRESSPALSQALPSGEDFELSSTVFGGHEAAFYGTLKALQGLSTDSSQEIATRFHFISFTRLIRFVASQVEYLQHMESEAAVCSDIWTELREQRLLKEQELEDLDRKAEAVREQCMNAGLHPFELLLSDSSYDTPAPWLALKGSERRLGQLGFSKKTFRGWSSEMSELHNTVMESNLLGHWTGKRDRINRWLLHTMLSDGEKMIFHQSMIPEENLDESSWLQSVLRHWFVDDVATGEELNSLASGGALDSFSSHACLSLISRGSSGYETCSEHLENGVGWIEDIR